MDLWRGGRGGPVKGWTCGGVGWVDLWRGEGVDLWRGGRGGPVEG